VRKPKKATTGRGRPVKDAGERLVQVAVRFPPALLAEVDAIRDGRKDGADRSAVVRELVVAGIEARGRSRK